MHVCDELILQFRNLMKVNPDRDRCEVFQDELDRFAKIDRLELKSIQLSLDSRVVMRPCCK